MKDLTNPEDLLQVLQPPDASFRKTATPLAAELPVDPALAPYLATTTKSLLWHPKDFGGAVRSALRTTPLRDLYTEVINEICATSVQAEWGSVQPYTLNGLCRAIEYLQSYGIQDVEILAPDAALDGLIGNILTFQGVTVVRVSYLPARTVAVVPKDRANLGVALEIGARRMLLVHNPSRGLAVAGWTS